MVIKAKHLTSRGAEADPFFRLALIVIKSAQKEKDKAFFGSACYEMWMGYVQACLPGELEEVPTPMKVK